MRTLAFSLTAVLLLSLSAAVLAQGVVRGTGDGNASMSNPDLHGHIKRRHT